MISLSEAKLGIVRKVDGWAAAYEDVWRGWASLVMTTSMFGWKLFVLLNLCIG